MGERIVELSPIKESTEDYEAVEAFLKRLWKREIYIPLLKILGEQSDKRLMNASEESALIEALKTGRITFQHGTFHGRFNASISKDLRALGARWDRKSSTYKARASSLPREVREAISASEHRFNQKIGEIDRQLAKILPEEIADKVSIASSFDRVLWKVDTDLKRTLKGITITPTLTPGQRKKIADEWQTNMRLWVKDFTEKEILKLRADVKKATFAGDRYEETAKAIQASYGVSARKATFLARQETSLLMTKFKETRYTDAGVNEYRWGCVKGTPAHPVRPSHKRLEGHVFRWDNPPITTEPGQPQRRNNPGQDYNCRCFAKPIVRFKTA